MLFFQFSLNVFYGKEAAGLFSAWHLVFSLAFIVMLSISLYACRRIKRDTVDRILWISAVAVIVSEVIKIVLRITSGGGVDTWIPLYYCSLFIYAIWMTRCRVKWLSRMGYAFITMGGILASLLFTLYPSTSLGIYPALHPASLHSFFYHLLMAFVGILVLWKGAFEPKLLDGALYGAFILTACIIGFIINEKYGSNCMFLHNAFGLPVLNTLLERSHTAYALTVTLAQGVGMYWLNFGLYTLFKKYKEKKTL